MDILDTELAKFSAAARYLDLPDVLTNRLRHPEGADLDFLVVELPEKKSSSIYCRRTCHSKLRGPSKGGFRMAEVETFNEADRETDALAMMMTWKTAVEKLPYGGAKGGLFLVKSDQKERFPGRFPKDLPRQVREALVKHWAYRLKSNEVIGPDRDIPAPDVDTDPQDMAWIKAAFNVDGRITSSAVTGKPVECGGSYGREEATGAGVFYIIADGLAPKLRFSLQGLRVVIQGFGNLGSIVAKYLHLAGAKIIAVDDSAGGIYNIHGINPFLAASIKKEAQKEGVGAYASYYPADRITHKELLELTCDLFIPSAVQDLIHAKNADRLRTRLIVEGANSPITGEAANILRERGITIVPGILANGGGVIVSYLEWVQDLQSYFFKEDEVHRLLREMIAEAFEGVWAVHKTCRLTLEEAAMAIGVARVAQTAWLLGKDVPAGWTPRFPSPIDELAKLQPIRNPGVTPEEAEKERILHLIRQK